MRARVFSVGAVFCDILKSKPPVLWVVAGGQVPSLGWTKPELSPWIYIRPPADGILDLDFSAESPSGFSGGVMTPIITSDVFMRVPTWVKGVRVHASSNSMEAMPGSSSGMAPAGEGMPLPWPFPWYVEIKE